MYQMGEAYVLLCSGWLGEYDAVSSGRRHVAGLLCWLKGAVILARLPWMPKNADDYCN